MSAESPGTRRSKAAQRRTNPRVRDREATRRRLLDAAIHVLARDGYSAARIEDIAAEAGVTRATFYLHFGSKSDIIQTIVDPTIDIGWNDHYRRLNALGDFSWDELRSWMSEVASWYEEHRSLNSVLDAALIQEPGFSAIYFATDQTAADYLTHYMAKHRQSPEVARLRITTLVEGLTSMLYLTKVGEAEVDEDQLLDALTDVWWAVLRGEAAPKK